MAKVLEEPTPEFGPVPWTVGDIARGIAVVIALFIPFLFAVMLGAVLILGWEGVSHHFVILVLLSGLVLEGVMLLAVWRFSVVKYRCSWKALGFRSFNLKRALILIAVVLGASLLVNFLYEMLITSLGMEPPSTLPPEFTQTGVSLAILSFLAILVAPFAEETFFRGFIFSGIGTRFGYGWGAVLSALLFSLAHLQLGALVPIFLLGLLLAWLYLKTHSIWTCIFTHLAYNSIAILLVV